MSTDGRALLRVVRLLLLAVAAVLTLSLGWTGGALLAVREDLTRLQQTVSVASDDRDETSALLAEAERTLARTSRLLGQPGPALVAQIPLLGRTPEAVRRTSDATLVAVRTGRSVLDVLDAGPLVDQGRIDLERLAEVQARLAEGSEQAGPVVARLRRLDTGLLPPSVGSVVRDARELLLPMPDSLAGYVAATGSLRALAGGDGPREVLVVLQNNAELRGAGGLMSVFATARAEDGRISVSAFRDVEEVADSAAQARPVPAPDDFSALFGPLLADTTLWKNSNADPDVPTSSAVVAEVAEATLVGRPDAVVWLDVPAVAAVLAGTSPAQLPDGGQLTADNAVEQLLVASYDEAEDTEAGQRARRERLRAAADAVAVRLLAGSPDLTRLVPELAAAARGRHLALWSADEQEQQGWRAAGLAGEVDPGSSGDLLNVSVHNLGDGGEQGNKLDYYTRRAVAVDVVVGADEAEVVQRVELSNEAPETGLPGYVAGEVAPGTSNSLLLLAVPGSAQVTEFLRAGQPLRTDTQPLRDEQVLSDVVTLGPGTSAAWTVRYRIPVDALYRLTLVPQPLAVDAELSVTLRSTDGVRLEPVTGSPLQADGPDGALALDGPFDRQHELAVQVGRPGRLQRAVEGLRRWWSEPVQLP